MPPLHCRRSYLDHLGVPERSGEHGAQPLGRLVDGDAAEERLVVHVAVGEAGEAVRVQHLHRPVEEAVLRPRPELPSLGKWDGFISDLYVVTVPPVHTLLFHHPVQAGPTGFCNGN